jgi:hypothetical protein
MKDKNQELLHRQIQSMTEDNTRLSTMYEMMCKVKKPEEETSHVTKGKGNFEVSFTKHERIRDEELSNNAIKGGWKPTSEGSTVHFNPDNTLRYRDPKPVSTNAATLKRL